MPHFYVDLDNNKLITGSSSTQIAATPSVYQGDKPTLELELITRSTGVMAQYTSAASAVNVRIGALGFSSVASAITLSVVTLSATATATVGLNSPVTAIGTATLLGSVTATATVVLNSPTVITITPTVTTLASAKAVAYLGGAAIPPVIKYSLSPAYDRYLDVVEAGTPYDSETTISGDVTSVAQTFKSLINIGVPIDYVTNVSTTHFFIIRSFVGAINAINFTTSTAGGYNNLFAQTEFLTRDGSFMLAENVVSLSQINLKNASYAAVSYGRDYFRVPGTAIAVNSSIVPNNAFFTANQITVATRLYSCVVLRSSQPGVTSALTASYPYTINGISVSTLGINIGPAYVESYAAGLSTYSGSEAIADNVSNIGVDGLLEVRIAVSAGVSDSFKKNNWGIAGPNLSEYSGEAITLNTETMIDGKKQISGGQIAITDYQHRPLEALPKTGLVTIYPSSAYLNRRVERIEITSCGDQYVTVPSVLISEPENENGLTAKATAEITGNKLSKIIITNPGDGYSVAPDIFILPPVEKMKSATARTVTSVVTYFDRQLVLALASGTTISDNSWCMLSGLGKADGLAYVVTVATGGTNTTLKFPYNVGTVTSTGTATVTPLVPYVRVTGAVVSGTDASFSPNSTLAVNFSSPSCSDTDAVVSFAVLNSGALALSSVLTPGFANSFSIATLSAYKKITSLTVTCAGNGYYSDLPEINVDNGSFVATAPGAALAVVTAALNGAGGIILSVSCAGYGYTSAPTITILPPSNGGGVRSVSLNTAGVGYSDGTFSCAVATAPAGGSTAVINFVQNETVQTFVVADPGRGYVATPAVTVPAPDLGGQVARFTITSAGAGYIEAPAVTLTGGGGTGAAATAILTNGTVTSISLTSQGSGYTSAPTASLSVPPSSVYYSKQIDLSGASVTTLLAGNSSASAYLQIEEKRGSDTTVLAQVPITIQARIS